MYFFIDPFGSVSNLRVSGPDWMVNAKGSEPDWHYRARHGTSPCRRGDRTGLALLLLFVAEKAALADELRHLRWYHFIPAFVPTGDALEHVPGKDRQIFRVEIIELDEAAATYQVTIERLQLGFHLDRVDGLQLVFFLTSEWIDIDF